MSFRISLLIVFVILFGTIGANAQASREYLPAPIGTTMIETGYLNIRGSSSIETMQPLPIDGKGSKTNTGYIRFGHWFKGFRDQFAAVGLIVPVVQNTNFKIDGTRIDRNVRGFGDMIALVGWSWKGAPAMKLPEFMKWEFKQFIGSTVYVYIPSGAYKSNQLVNVGSNRWTFVPDIHWGRQFKRGTILEGIARVWFNTKNDSYLVNKTLQSSPMLGLEVFFSQNFTPKLFASFETRYKYGGGTKIDGVSQDTRQNRIDLGFLVNYDFNLHHHAKFLYTNTAGKRSVNPDVQYIRAVYYYTW